MMTNLFKVFLFSSWMMALPAEAASGLSDLKRYFAEKKVDEAIKILKVQNRSILKTNKDHEELSRLLSLFLFDDTMVIHEKALGLMEAKPEEAEAEFKKALSAEPYNKVLISHYVSFLISSDRAKSALPFLEEKIAEQPYMALYKIYDSHAKALVGQTPAVPNCEAAGLNDLELRYCYLVQVIAKVSVSPLSPSRTEAPEPLSAKYLTNMVKKIRLPDAHYWAWKGRNDREELKKYISECQGLSANDKKNYRIIPGVCNKLEEAVQNIKTVAICTTCNKGFFFPF